MAKQELKCNLRAFQRVIDIGTRTLRKHALIFQFPLELTKMPVDRIAG